MIRLALRLNTHLFVFDLSYLLNSNYNPLVSLAYTDYLKPANPLGIVL